MTTEPKRTIFFVSDGTGITAETIGHSLITQFERIAFKQVRIPFVDSASKAERALEKITREAERSELRPIVINTFVDSALSRIIYRSPGLVVDVLDTFLGMFEQELGVARTPRVGQAHGLVEYQTSATHPNSTPISSASE